MDSQSSCKNSRGSLCPLLSFPQWELLANYSTMSRSGRWWYWHNQMSQHHMYVCLCVVLCCRIHMSVPVPVTHSEDRPSASHRHLPHGAPWESHPVPWWPWSCSALRFCPFKNVIQMDSYSTWPFDTTLFCNTHPSCSETRGLNRGPRGLRRTVHSPETSHSHIWERSLNLPCQRVGNISLRNRGTVVQFCQVVLWVISRICL